MLNICGKLVKISWKTLEIKESAENLLEMKNNQLKKLSKEKKISWKIWKYQLKFKIMERNQLLKCKIVNVEKVDDLAHCEKLHLNLWVIQALI